MERAVPCPKKGQIPIKEEEEEDVGESDLRYVRSASASGPASGAARERGERERGVGGEKGSSRCPRASLSSSDQKSRSR